MWKDLKAFLFRGDVLTLAVAVVIGGAFQKIIDSLVNDVIMPIIGAVTGGADFTNNFIQLAGESGAKTYAEAQKAGATLGWGSFLQACINFFIVGIALYFMVKAAGKKTDAVS